MLVQWCDYNERKRRRYAKSTVDESPRVLSV